jgi:predicted ATPase/transcriptional regulator with XRE-family HTH domain
VIQKVIQKVISPSRTLMDDIPTFGIWLKRRRKALDLTQAALAQLVGCSVVSIRKFEGDEQPPSRQLAELLATQLQIPPNERATFIQFARVGLDSAPPTLPLPAEARLPQPMGATPAPERATPTAAPSVLATHTTPSIRDLPPLVGRSAEWQTLQAVWAAARQGYAQLAVIIGEAGIGKTRLAEELLAQASQQGALTAQAHTYATAGRLTYAPLIAWLRTPALKQRLGQLRDADLTELARLMPELLSERVGLAPPNPMTESWQRLRLFEALMRAVLADQQPLLLMLDDLQWSDQETLDWLHFLLRYEPRARLLIIATVRIEEVGADHPLATLQSELRRSDQLTEIALGPLRPAETAALAEHIAGRSLSMQAAADLHIATEGNPLFVVETIRADLSTGARAQGSAVEPLGDRPMPSGVQAVIAHRLKQIAPAARDLLCLAAVIGRSFTFGVLARAAASDEDTLVRGLDELWQRRIVREQGSDAYDFSHDKLRAVAYAGLSAARRRVLHRRVAEALEAEHAADLDALSEQIAWHYERAGIADRSVEYYQRAAEVAQRVYANAEAIGHLTKGLEVLATLPASPERLQHELDLQTTLGHTLMVVKGYAAPEVQQVYGRARELCRQVEQTPQLFQVLWGLGYFYILRSQCRMAREVGEQLLSLAQRTQDPILLQQAHNVLAGASLHLGELSAAQAHLQQGLALYDRQQHRALVLRLGMDLGVFFLAYMVRPLWLLGYPDQAITQSQKALTMAQELAHPFSLTYALTFAALGHQFRREVQATHMRAEASCALAGEKGIAFFVAFGTGLRGWALAKQGQSDAGLLQMREGMAACRATGAEADRPYFLTLVAEAYGREGRYGEGLAMLEEALALVDQSEERYWEAEIHRLKGELLLARSAENQVEAESCLDKALDVARRQGAKSLELRAAMSLGRLWQRQGKRVTAHDLLAPIYGWFTEGFDTADLQEAKTLLAALT